MHPTVDEQLDGIARLIEQAAGDLTAGDLAADDLAAGPMADRLRTAAGTLRRLAAAWPAVLPFLTWDNAATLRLLDTLGEVPGSGVAAIAARAHAVAAAPLDPLDAAEVHARNLELRGLLAEAVRALPPARPPSEGPSGDDPARVARSSVAAHVRARIARDPSGGRPRPGPSPTLTPSPDLAPRPNPT